MAQIRPYGKVSAEEKRAKVMELLAQHALEWEGQARAFSKQNPQGRQSILYQDAAYRERVRERAKMELCAERHQPVSWERSLRSDEELVEIQIGRVNPIVCVRPKTVDGIAIRQIINMQPYVPVEQRLPAEYLQRNRRILQDRFEVALEEKIDIEELPVEDLDAEPIPKTAELSRPCLAGNDLLGEAGVLQATKTLFPAVRINSVTFTASEGRTASLQLENVGDCVVRATIRRRDLQEPPQTANSLDGNAPKPKQADTPSAGFVPVLEKPSKQGLGTARFSGLAYSTASSPGKSRRSPVTSTYRERAGITTSFQSQGSQRETATTSEDLQQKMLEKSTTPAGLRVLADRYLQEDGQEILVGAVDSQALLGVGSTRAINFILPQQRSRPGVMLQEYELEFTPACQVLFSERQEDAGFQRDVQEKPESTVVRLRVYGVNSQVLQQAKQLQTREKLARTFCGSLERQFLCSSILYDLADEALLESFSRHQAKKKVSEEKQKTLEGLQEKVVRAYTENVLKPKWLRSKAAIRGFLYQTIAEFAGLALQPGAVWGSQDEYFEAFSRVGRRLAGQRRFGAFVAPQAVVFARHSGPFFKTLSASAIPRAALVCSKTVQQSQNSSILDTIRQRLFSGPGEEPCGRVPVEGQAELDTLLLRRACARDRATTAQFARFERHLLVQELASKVLRTALPYCLKQCRLNPQLQASETASDNRIHAPWRLGYSEDLSQLVLLAAATGAGEPCLQVCTERDAQKEELFFSLLRLRICLQEAGDAAAPELREFLRLRTPLRASDKFLCQLKDYQDIFNATVRKERVEEHLARLVARDLRLLGLREKAYVEAVKRRPFLETALEWQLRAEHSQEIPGSILGAGLSQDDEILQIYYTRRFGPQKYTSLQQEVQKSLQQQQEAAGDNRKAKGSAQKRPQSQLKRPDNAVEGQPTAADTQGAQVSSATETPQTLSQLYLSQMVRTKSKGVQMTSGGKKYDTQQFYLIHRLAGRGFADFPGQSDLKSLMSQVLGHEVPCNLLVEKPSLREVLLDAVSLCIQLAVFPESPVLDLISAPEIQRPHNSQVEQLKANILLKVQKPPEQKVQKKTPEPVRQEPPLQVQTALQTLSGVAFAPLDSLVDFEDMQLQVEKGQEEPDEALNFEAEHIEQPTLTRSQSLSALVNNSSIIQKQKSFTSFTDKAEIPPAVDNISPLQGQIPSIESSHGDNREFIWHDLRIKAMRREFDCFVDAIVSEAAEQAVQSHLVALEDLEGQEMVWEKIQLVRAGQLSSDDIGMLPEEIDAFMEPRRPGAEEYFQDFLQENTLESKQFVRATNEIFLEDYSNSAIQLLRDGLLRQLDAWRTQCLDSARTSYEDPAEAEAILETFFQPKIAALKAAAATPQGLEEINQVVLIPLGLYCALPAAQSELQKLYGADVKPSRNVSLHATQAEKFLESTAWHDQGLGKIDLFRTFLLKKGAVFDSSSLNKVEAPDVLDMQNLQIEQLVKLPAKKPKAAGAKPPLGNPFGEIKPQQSLKPEQEEEEFVDEEELPPYQRTPSALTAARRDIWAWFFDNCLERALNWFDAVEQLPSLLERARNYTNRDWEEFVI